MTIHNEHPFLPGDADRSPVRRLRGRLASPVTIWAAEHDTDGDRRRAGLTVSSLLVADGEPGYVIGMIDPLSDLWDALRVSRSAVVNVLGWQHRSLADVFGYVAPAPGGPFKQADWQVTQWGPALQGCSWAGCRLAGEPATETDTVGWGLLVRLVIEHTELADDSESAGPLVHRRGRYHTF